MSSIKFRHNIALVVGINDYQDGVPILKTPVNDAQTLAEILQTQHDYQIHVLLNQDAKRNPMMSLLEGLSQQIEASDRLLFYFAGHGIALNGEDGPEGYLLPQDARLGDVNTYLSMSQVHNALLQLPCSHFLGILDCCFAGSFRWSSVRKLVPMDLGVIHKERFDRFIQDPAWQVITSAAHDQTALDAFDLQCRRMQSGEHSPFAAALIEALQGSADAYPPAEPGKPAGDGVTTATELYLYLRDRVEIATEARALRQTPGIHPLKKHDKGEYIFLTPGHELNLPPAPPLDESKNPYRGLRSFEEQHSELFFGRSDLIEKLHNFAKTHPLTVVLGASGSGKSSLVKAGLIPKLKRDAQVTHENWCILSPIRPGEAPFQALNHALVMAQLAAVELHNPQKTLAQSIAVWAHKHPQARLFIFIDQTEEIVTLCPNETERQEFFQQILTAIDAHRASLQVVLSLRSDFEPQIRDTGLRFVPEALDKLGHAELKNRWQSGRFIIPAMTRTELREAIEKPAEARVMYFQPHELVEQLIDEVADMPGALPLLSFALSELYLKYLRRQRDAQNKGVVIDRAITQDDYQDLGGVIQSLTQKADQEYQALVQENPAYAQMISQVMLRLIALGGGELARRQVSLSELEYPPKKNGLAKEVIERFTNARLLVKGKDAEDHFYVEPAHDALVRGWQRLLNWLKEEKNLRLQRRLTPAALEWKSQQQKQFLWDTDPYLDVLQEVLNSENNWLNQVEAEFVQRSIAKKRFNARRNWSIAIAVMLGLMSLTFWALRGLRNTQIEQIRNLTQSAQVERQSNHELEALLDVLKVEKLLDSWLLQLFKPDAEIEQLKRTLPKVVYTVQELNRLEWHRNPVMAVNFQSTSNGKRIVTIAKVNSNSPEIAVWQLDGRLEKTYSDQEVKDILRQPNGNFYKTLEQKFLLSLLNFSSDGKMFAQFDDKKQGTVNLWNSNGTRLKTFKAYDKPITTIKFSPDSQMIATGSWGKWVKLWKLDGTLYKTLKGHDSTVNALDFSRDGQMIASGSSDKTVKLWNRDGTLRKTLVGHQDEVWDVSISSDSQMIASGSNDGTVKLWNRDGTLRQTLVGHRDTVQAVRFSADGHILASASNDGTVKLWSPNSTPLTILHNYKDAVYTVRFNPDGKTIATTTGYGYVKLWRKNGTLLKTEQWQYGEITTLEFSPDGKLIVSGAGDRTVRLSRSNGSIIKLLKGHTGETHLKEVLAVSFSPDSQLFAIGDIEGTIELWNRDGSLRQTLPGHKAAVWGLSFSPDGQMIASASVDGTVKLWNRDGSLRQTLSSHGSRLGKVVFSPDRQPNHQIIAAASMDGTVKRWKRDGTALKPLVGHRNGVLAVAFSPNGQLMATASYDKTVKLWNRDGTLLKTFYGHDDRVNAVAFSPDGKRLASASNDKTVLLWNVDLNLDLDGLRKYTCNWMRNYLKNNPNVDERDRHLCDHVR